YSRLGKEPYLPKSQTSLSDLLNQVLLDLEPTIRETNAEITQDPLPTLPVHPHQILQLFQNLLSNALKFHDGFPPRVHIASEQKEGEWVVSVRDNGIGIEPQYRDQIFLMFKRLHTRQAYSGTGIGLAICKKIAEHHGGRIWVDSEPGKGSTFYF